MSNLAPLARRVAQLPILLASVALFALMVMTFADVILRSVLNAPIEAATELTRMLMAIVVFAVLPVLSSRDGHIVVDLFDRLFRGSLINRLRDAVISIICGAMLILPAGRVLVLAERARSYGDLTEYLNIPQFYIGWFIAIMTYITALVLLLRGVIALFAPKLLEDFDA
ncbi:MAG: TRAP transporter small permease [Hyphomicrobiales bacterium]|nr:TRAP transporter small permease [Hyphomicrobiales bacterium]MCP5001705.1 TRAP transporter small permease [Hyphomicrobiales bacterium]